MTDFAARRTMMVDTQVRPNDVTKFTIIDAMLSVPREDFVPAPLRDAAYVGENLEIAPGRVMLEPRTLAKLLDALDPQPGDRVMILGAGLGYTAALVARMAGHVVAVEDVADLVVQAEAQLKHLANVTLVSGPVAAGAAKDGPYDCILVEGGAQDVPDAILAQLKDGGRIGAVFMQGALGQARIGHHIDHKINWRFSFNAAAPVLADFVRKQGFTF